jgi:hypothetical protein
VKSGWGCGGSACCDSDPITSDLYDEGQAAAIPAEAMLVALGAVAIQPRWRNSSQVKSCSIWVPVVESTFYCPQNGSDQRMGLWTGFHR